MTDWGNLYSLDSQRHRNHLQKKTKKNCSCRIRGEEKSGNSFYNNNTEQKLWLEENH